MFINYSNHPSERWGKYQLSEAEKYGEIIDIDFFPVPVEYSSKDVINRAKKEAETILKLLGDDKEASVVMCQGEFTLTFALVNLLQHQGVKVVAGLTERMVEETNVDGKTHKSVTFQFMGFREYSFWERNDYV